MVFIYKALQQSLLFQQIQRCMKKTLISKINNVFPKLSIKGSKGDNGRIAVIGGSYEFSGAPFYSAISALKTGGDLAHIFCSKASSDSIKSYSPQIIVHPVFESQEQVRYSQDQLKQVHKKWIQKIGSWQKAIHTWVIGPGLGRDRYMQEFFPTLVQNIGRDKVVVFDADGIYYLAQNPKLFNSLKRCKTILTPNLRQLNFIQPFLKFNKISDIKYQPNNQQIQQLPSQYSNMHNFSLVIKGHQDYILGKQSYIVRTQSGLKRCGGIGDILAGAISVCSLWDFQKGPALASRITKMASKRAYEKSGRSLTAPMIIKQLPGVIKTIEEQQNY